MSEGVRRVAAYGVVGIVVALGILASFGVPIPLLPESDNMWLALWRLLLG